MKTLTALQPLSVATACCRTRLQTMVAAGLVVAFALQAVPTHCHADSLWPRRCPRRAFVVADSRARRTGDLLTIIVSESTTVSNREDKGLSKSSGASGLFDLAAATGGGFGISAADGNLAFNKSTNRNFDGEASYQNSQRFADRMTVTVTGVTSEGNLILEGTRSIQIAGEFRTLNVSGIVRPIDIGPDNTVTSHFVANLTATYEGDGPERRFTRQGWLGRGMNKVWPF